MWSSDLEKSEGAVLACKDRTQLVTGRGREAQNVVDVVRAEVVVCVFALYVVVVDVGPAYHQMASLYTPIFTMEGCIQRDRTSLASCAHMLLMGSVRLVSNVRNCFPFLEKPLTSVSQLTNILSREACSDPPRQWHHLESAQDGQVMTGTYSVSDVISWNPAVF